VRYSEGNSYNILRHTISNEENMKVSGKLSQGHISHANEIQRKQRETGIARLELQETRSLNRPHFNRWKGEVDRGYGLIDNLPKESFLPYPQRPKTVWSRLQESTSSLSNNAVGNVNTSDYVRSAGHTPYAYPGGSTSASNQLISPVIRPSTTTIPPMSSRGGVPTSRGNVPALDLTLTEAPAPVSYKEVPGPAGMAIPIVVRTGGLSKA
jgi:hypothetical protein